MADFDFGAMLESAKEAGGTSDALLPDGSYSATVVSTNAKVSSKGKLQVGLKFRVDGGPQDGVGVWSNQTLSPESPVALDIFFRTFEALGIPRNGWSKYGTDLKAAGAAVAEAVKGAQALISTKQREYPEGSGQMQNDVKSIRPAPAGSAGTPASVPTLPTQSGPAPTAPRVPF